MATSTTPGNEHRGPVIGIDLGTTYSCVAVCQNSEVTIIRNEIGESTTPSHVQFPDLTQPNADPTSIAVGDAAKNSATMNPANSIYDVKRLIGRRFDESVVVYDMKRWPFTVINEDNSPRVRVNGKSYHPEQISAKILAYLKKQAETQLRCQVSDAVITVPAYFNDAQRQATKDAGLIAGLNVLRILNEPTAAAIAYNHQLQQQAIGSDVLKKKNVLIFDLGGGTFDLAVLTMEGGNITVKAVDGDTHLGGQDFDNAMVDYCLNEFKEKYKVDLSEFQLDAAHMATEKFNVRKRLRRIKNECETKKINLSSAQVVTIHLEVFYNGHDMKIRFTRETFQSINQPLFDKCIKLVDRILRDAKMSTEDIDDVVLVGGSSRIPKIQEMIEEYFGREPCRNIRQDEAVAYGAAVQASQLASDGDGETLKAFVPGFNPLPVVLTDVIPHSIGVQVHVSKDDVNDFSAILKKNTPVPCKAKNTFYTGYDGQSEALISVYEGQSTSVAANHLLAEFVIDNLPHDCPKGEKVDIYMEINDDGILEVTAECPANEAKNNITVRVLNGRLKKDDVDQCRFEELNFATLNSFTTLDTF